MFESLYVSGVLQDILETSLSCTGNDN